MSQPTNPIATLSHFVPIHGINLMVYKYQEMAYVPLKAIVDLIGTDWRTAKRSAIDGDNQKLYGTIRLLAPFLDNTGGFVTPQTILCDGVKGTLVGVKPHQNTDFEEDIDENLNNNSTSSSLVDMVCIRFDRVAMYLARVNTSRLRSNGNVSSADYLLALQQEWADALHSYETYGIAVKKNIEDNMKYVNLLANTLAKLTDQQQRYIISKKIDEAIGLDRQLIYKDKDNDQADLFVP